MARDNKNQTRTVINNHLKQFKKPLTKKLTFELSPRNGLVESEPVEDDRII